MPYASNAELPEPVRKALPRHAQDIYRAAFNDAYEHYGPKREEVAHRIAWGAVKHHYVKLAAGVWIRRARLA
jgi:cation transport regulator